MSKVICDECETVAHCMKNGCIPKQPAPVAKPHEQEPSDLDVWKARALQAEAVIEKFMAKQPAQPGQEPVAFLDWYDNAHWGNEDFKDGCWRAWDAALEHTSPPAQRKWLDPNDKTQKQYLPHIGEPVLFCHKGMTYVGKHTGGSFQSEVTNQYFNTWECHWMYLPAAYGIKENT